MRGYMSARRPSSARMQRNKTYSTRRTVIGSVRTFYVSARYRQSIQFGYTIVRMTKTRLLQGTLDLLILGVLEVAPLHGLGIADRIEQVTHGALHIKAGSLFPAL